MLGPAGKTCWPSFLSETQISRVHAPFLVRYRFTQDYSFSSPSMAAAVVLGRSANGRIEWKDAQGRTLKELQEAEAGS